MFLPLTFRQWSANESPASPDDEAAALLSGSSESPPPTPEQEPDTPDDAQAVPYDRFKAVNDQLRDAKQQLEEFQALKPAAEATPSVPADEISKAVAAALKEVGIDKMAQEVKAVRLERVRERTMSELRQMPDFDEQRDLPRIVETMKAKQVNAMDAFILVQHNAPPSQAPVVHDARGQSAASIETPANANMSVSQSQAEREAAGVEQMKQMFRGNPSLKKALEL